MDAVAELDFSDIIASDPSTYVDNFLAIINELYCRSFPLCTKFISKKRMSKPWITPNILSLIKQKSNAFQLYRRGIISMRENNLIKNKITSAIRISKRQPYKNTFNKFKNNMHKTWSTIKSVLQSSQNKNTIKAILFNNVEVTDDFDIAQLFNNFFTGVATELESNIPATNTDPLSLISRVDSSLFLYPVSVEECSNVISKLKNTKTGFNQLPVKFYKSLKNILSPVISSIANCCFATGTFPEQLKSAVVTPIFKKGDRKNVSNYRPIANLPILSKIIEKLIHIRFNNFFSKFNIINPNQFGFQSGKSTEQAIIRLIDSLYDCINQNKFAIAVFVDYKKAFDTINHEILIKN